MGDESARHVPESLEELSGEWMRQQLQEAAVNTGPPPQEPRKPESPPRSSWSAQPATAATPAPQPPVEPAAPAPDDVLAGLAQSVSQAVVSAVSQLEYRRNAEKQNLETAVHDQEQLLRSALDRVTEIQLRLDRISRQLEQQQTLAATASDSYERLAGEIVEIHRRDVSRESVLEDLRRETLDLSVSVSDRQDHVSGRLELQHADIEGLKSDLAHLKPAVEHSNERLNRHSAALKAVFEAERRREDALERLSEAASSLRSSTLRLPEGLSEELL